MIAYYLATCSKLVSSSGIVVQQVRFDKASPTTLDSHHIRLKYGRSRAMAATGICGAERERERETQREKESEREREKERERERERARKRERERESDRERWTKESLQTLQPE